jgi:hypothetical protein
MMPIAGRTAPRKLLLVALLALSLIVSLAGSPAASAAVRSCRRDPIITMSNGYNFNVTAVLATAPDDVESIVYTVHGPKGLAMTRVVYTGDKSRAREKVVFVADQEANTYSVDTVATTETPEVETTVTVAEGGQRWSVTGPSGTHLVVEFVDEH